MNKFFKLNCNWPNLMQYQVELEKNAQRKRKKLLRSSKNQQRAKNSKKVLNQQNSVD